MTSGSETPIGPDDDLLGRLLAGEQASRAGVDDAHAGHGHDDPLRPTADLSVRPAVPEDAERLADIHARTLRATLAAGTGAELGPDVRAALGPEALVDAWREAITAPPSPVHRVLSACAGAEVVGFAAIAPAEVPLEVVPAEEGAEGGAAEPGPTAEILALEVPAAHGRAGHGSRLLAACAELLREQGVARVQTWAVREDEARTRFLSSAGFAPAGLRRTLDVGGSEVVELCWYAQL